MTALQHLWTDSLGFGSSQLVLFGVILCIGLWLGGFLVLVFEVAESKGRSGFAWAVVGLLYTPLIALIALAAMPDRQKEEERPDVPEAPEVPEFKWRQR